MWQDTAASAWISSADASQGWAGLSSCYQWALEQWQRWALNTPRYMIGWSLARCKDVYVMHWHPCDCSGCNWISAHNRNFYLNLLLGLMWGGRVTWDVHKERLSSQGYQPFLSLRKYRQSNLQIVFRNTKKTTLATFAQMVPMQLVPKCSKWVPKCS